MVEHWSNKPTVAGSIPVVSTYNIFFLNIIAYYIRLAHLAQKVERWPFKPMVVGSIPTMSALITFKKIKEVII